MTTTTAQKPVQPKRKTTGRYTRRKIVTDVTTTKPPIPTESSFMEGLRKNLTERDAQIKDRLAQIETESDALEVEEAALKQEQEKVQAGLKALEK
jgi:hypothetical protein